MYKKKQSDKCKSLKPLSLYPLTPKQALKAFMQTDPKELKRLEKEEHKGK